MTERELVRQFLLAWRDSIEYQRVLVPVLAQTLGVDSQNIFYERHLAENFEYSGILKGTKWKYAFHGIADCDLYHGGDGRFVQIGFGPHGRFDTFSGWGTMLYIMASKPPWPEYLALKQHLAGKPPPYDYLSGSHKKMVKLLKPIEDLGLFEAADKELTRQKVELQEKYTYVDNEGRHILSLPAPFNDVRSKLFWDLRVCDSSVLSEQGKKLFERNFDVDYFSDFWEKYINGSV
ncbi:MAG: hypothetical protein GY943_11920 [Chloroflexi bacterium]|nr:hypothetical protein [Chloroflexota bacterium]